MEKSIGLLDLIKQSFSLKEVDIRTYSPLTLAYIGDCVFDLIIRTVVVERGNEPTSKLHHKTVFYVKAETQARLIDAMISDLTEEEFAVYKRGRNAKSYTMAKNASVEDYRKATGLEALAGYLYLLGRTERFLQLLQIGLHKLDMKL